MISVCCDITLIDACRRAMQTILRRLLRATGASMLAAAIGGVASAQAPLHPWLVPPPKYDPQAYFTNLSQGALVQSPFVVKFGMSYWGIAPAGQDYPLTGHHHLLVDQKLPADIQAPIPFSEKYMHFGKGQMETVLNLPPGKHTLRLLLADHQHRPHFVFSPTLNIEVVAGESKLAKDYGKAPQLEFIGLADKQVLERPFRLVFHASGLNVATRSSKVAGTGTFRVRFMREGQSQPAEEVSLPNGQTEAWFSPPKGNYRVQLLFEGNPDGKLLPIASDPLSIVIGK